MSRSTFPRFLVAGGLAALANMGSRLLLEDSIPYVPSIVLAYLIGMVTAFTLNRRFVFTGADNALGQQLVWFTIINIAALAQTVLVSVILADFLLPWLGWEWRYKTVAHVVGVIVPVFTSYLGHRRLTFRN